MFDSRINKVRMLNFHTVVLYLLSNTLICESMTPVKPGKHHFLISTHHQRASPMFDPAPSSIMRRKRRVFDQVAGFNPPPNVQSTAEKIAEKALTNFFKNNAFRKNVVPTSSTKRPEVTLKPFELSKSIEIEKKGLNLNSVGAKRSTAVFSLSKPHPFIRLRTSEALPLDVLENLVLAIHKNNNQNIADVIRDMRSKLDVLYKKHVGGVLRQAEDTVKKPKKIKPKNIVKEMDSILEDYLRAGQPSPETPNNLEKPKKEEEEVSSDESDDDTSGHAYMRGYDRERKGDDLEYELDGEGLNVAWKSV